VCRDQNAAENLEKIWVEWITHGTRPKYLQRPSGSADTSEDEEEEEEEDHDEDHEEEEEDHEDGDGDGDGDGEEGGDRDSDSDSDTEARRQRGAKKRQGIGGTFPFQERTLTHHVHETVTCEEVLGLVPPPWRTYACAHGCPGLMGCFWMQRGRG
jgi:hypothetical protein